MREGGRERERARESERESTLHTHTHTVLPSGARGLPLRFKVELQFGIHALAFSEVQSFQSQLYFIY